MYDRNSVEVERKQPVLCYVTDRRSLPSAQERGSDSIDSLLRKIEEWVAAGIPWIQIREKDLSAKELARLTRNALRIVRTAADHPATRILLNERVDVALAEGADGVHLPSISLRPAAVKELLEKIEARGVRRENFLIGASCHSLNDARAAAASGADYIFFGPVFATPSKAAFGTPLGLDRLSAVCSSLQIPVIAIGGITLENAASCLTAGAAGIAAIRMFQDAKDARGVLESLQDSVR